MFQAWETVTKQEILKYLDEIAWRFVRVPDADPEHYRALGIAFGTAWMMVSLTPDTAIEQLAQTIDDLALSGGSVQ